MSAKQERDVVHEPEEATSVRPPRRFAVLLHNDDYTTMEFVMEVLMRFFGKTETEAHALMLRVHTQGKAVAGLYAKDVAETKVRQVTDHARAHEAPLRVTAQPE